MAFIIDLTGGEFSRSDDVNEDDDDGAEGAEMGSMSEEEDATMEVEDTRAATEVKEEGWAKMTSQQTRCPKRCGTRDCGPSVFASWCKDSLIAHADLGYKDVGKDLDYDTLCATLEDRAVRCPDKGVGQRVRDLRNTAGRSEREGYGVVLANLRELLRTVTATVRDAEANSPGGQPEAGSVALRAAEAVEAVEARGGAEAGAGGLAQSPDPSSPPHPLRSPLLGTASANRHEQGRRVPNQTLSSARAPPATTTGRGTITPRGGIAKPSNKRRILQPDVAAAEAGPWDFPDDSGEAGGAEPRTMGDGVDAEAETEGAPGSCCSGDSPFGTPAAAPGRHGQPGRSGDLRKAGLYLQNTRTF
jgi:hypothetical protein